MISIGNIMFLGLALEQLILLVDLFHQHFVICSQNKNHNFHNQTHRMFLLLDEKEAHCQIAHS